MNKVSVLYFASLRERAGVETETLDCEDGDLRALYAQCQTLHGFPWTTAQLRVAVNGDFAGWADPVQANSEVAFIPPVSGG